VFRDVESKSDHHPTNVVCGGSQIRIGYVDLGLEEWPDLPAELENSFSLLRQRGLTVTADSCLGSTLRQTEKAILEGHRTSRIANLVWLDIAEHAQAAPCPPCHSRVHSDKTDNGLASTGNIKALPILFMELERHSIYPKPRSRSSISL
jgi:hypothetical protein